MRPNVPKLIFAGLLTIYFLWIAFDPMAGSFLDLVDLPMHETGHLIFRLLGEFMSIAGGSLFQVIVPCVFVGYFVRRLQYYSAAIVLFWVGQSILNVWIYAADAAVMKLVLTSGFTGTEGSFHDWNYLLTRTGLIGYTRIVAGIIRVIGTVVIATAAISSIYFALYPAPVDEDL